MFLMEVIAKWRVLFTGRMTSFSDFPAAPVELRQRLGMCHPRTGQKPPYLTPVLNYLGNDIEVGQESHIQMDV